jgi:hypothetical protein
MSKEVKIKESTELVTTPPETMVYGASEDITTTDISIGRIHIMQALSDLVKNDVFKSGDIINLLTNEKIGDKKTPSEFIPIKSFKYWLETDIVTKKFVAKRPAISTTELPWEEGHIKRTFVHAFYVILPSEVIEGMATPYELSFKSTDLNTARKLSAFLLKLKLKKLASWDKVFYISSVLRQKDSYSWYGSDVAIARDATQDERKHCRTWYDLISSSANINIVEDVVEEELF